MSSFFPSNQNRNSTSRTRQVAVPLCLAAVVGCVTIVLIFSGPDAGTARNLNADGAPDASSKADATSAPRAATDAVTVTPGDASAASSDEPSSPPEAILALIGAGAALSIDSETDGQAVAFPQTMSFRPEILDELSALPEITAVSIQNSGMDDSGIRRLVKLTTLQSLSLVDTNVTDEGIASLAQLTSLRRLRLSGVEISDAQVAMLARLPSLQSLDLSGSSLRPDAAGMLGAASGLTRIDLTETGTSMETRLNLQAALPDAAILPKINAEPPVPAAVTEGEIQNAASQLTAIDSEPPIASVSLAPLPTDEAIDASRGKVQSILKSEYAAAKTRDKQRDLARKLLALSRDFDRDDPARFVILDEAIRFALKSADWQFAVDVVDELGQTFAVNLHRYQASVMANAARLSNRSDAAGVCRLALGYANSAVDHERYAEAINLIQSALASARRSDVPALTRRAVDRAKEITAFSKAYEESQVARTILKHTPEDAGANLTLGRYLALYRGD
jgi:hypothetical protein